PVVQGIQTVIGEAVRWLEYNKPDQLDHFQQLQTIRFNLMYMRTQIGLGDIDKIRGTAAQLGVHGLMYGMAMEDGKVGQMFGRMHELLEDERLKGNDEHHVTPEMVNKLQTAVINEQIELAEKGLSSFGDLSEGKARLDSAISEYKRNNPGATSEQVKAGCEAEYEEYGKIREPLVNTLTRTVRASYDVFVSSQRQGVLVARGKRLTGGEAYFSDPSSGPLNVYNLEDLAIKKFDMYNAHDQEFIAKIKINMAEGSIKDRRKAAGKMTSEAKAAGRNLTPEEQRQVADANRDLTEHEKEELGTRLFRDIFAMPDFFSSGWRIAGYLNSIDQRCIAHFEGQGDDEVTARRKGLELSKDFALFMRLRAPEARKDMTGKEQDDKKKEPILERIAEIRPEEIVRLFRERIQNDHSPATESMRTRLASLYAGLSRIDGDVTNYDSFKKKYGAIIQNLRQKGFKEMRQLRIGQNLTNQERTTVNTWFEDGNASNKLQEMMRLMTDFSRASVTELATHDKFEDIYTRTILTDDALLDQLENSTQKDATGKTIEDRDGKPIEFTPISKMLSADQKGDPMIRIWNDTAQAINAGKSLIDFIKKESPDEKFKAALEFGEATSQYNGQSSRAKTLRWTSGTYL
ncbi:MAG TPA: hypothetical protein VLH77_01060, partial [Gammaproteobacteria bacterium]|nr:hypothetical protein [Gammaproteobacteria bacterium]